MAKHTFKYKSNTIIVSSSSPKEETRQLAASMFKELKEIGALENRTYSLTIELAPPVEAPVVPQVPAEKPIEEAKKTKQKK